MAVRAAVILLVIENIGFTKLSLKSGQAAHRQHLIIFEWAGKFHENRSFQGGMASGNEERTYCGGRAPDEMPLLDGEMFVVEFTITHTI